MEKGITANETMMILARMLDYSPGGDHEEEKCLVGYYMVNPETGARKCIDVQASPGRMNDRDFAFQTFSWTGIEQVQWTRDWLQGFYIAGPVLGRMPHRMKRDLKFDFRTGCPDIEISPGEICEINDDDHFSYSELCMVFSYDFKSNRLTIGNLPTI